MTSTVKQVVAAKATLTSASLATLASSAYATTSVKDNTAGQPYDNMVEVSITPGTVSGMLPYASVFALASLDGANYQTGANATDESVMTLLGTIPLPSSSTQQTRFFGVRQAFNDILPPSYKIVIKNGSGAAFTAATVNVSDINLTVG